MRNHLHRVTAIPEELPGSVAGGELVEGLVSCTDSVAHIEKQCHNSGLAAASGGWRGITMPRPFGSQLVIFVRAQSWDLPEQLFLTDSKAWWDLEIPPSITLIVEEQFLSIPVAGKGRGTPQNEQRGFCWQCVVADLDSHWWPGGVRVTQSACPRAVGD